MSDAKRHCSAADEDATLELLKSLQEKIAALEADKNVAAAPAQEPKAPHIIRQEKLDAQYNNLEPQMQAGLSWLRAQLHEDRKSDIYLALRERRPSSGPPQRGTFRGRGRAG